jgi:hypothetical protein
MAVLLGFDPGGEDGYGWCIADHAPVLPLSIRATGVVDNARDALREALAHVGSGEQIVAAGIDAPLFWVPSGDRKADRVLRHELRDLGAPSPAGTVQAVNSLRGACLVQGILTGILLRDPFRSLPITESHPKALLWLLRLANRKKHPSGISLSSLSSQFRALKNSSADATDHERDAALATLSAWAMLSRPAGWRNLFEKEQNSYSPIEPPLGYWMPEVVEAVTSGATEEATEDQNEQQAVLRYAMGQARKVAQENPY